MKVALSASYYDNESVAKVLHECEFIYTTQVKNYNHLRKIFGDKIYIIPYSTPAMMEFLKTQHEGCEYITYGDLHVMHQRSYKTQGVCNE